VILCPPSTDSNPDNHDRSGAAVPFASLWIF
jgi:hypothetical protein